MLKIFYELLTGPLGPLGLPIEPVHEWLIMLSVGAVVHEIAWRVSPGGRWGSQIYWLTKIVAIIAIWMALVAVIALCRFVASHWQLLILAGSLGAWLAFVIWLNTKVKSRMRKYTM